ncbi:type I inositol 1,4,5-trisphosphate 5-phosphatase-like isoform X2 [Mizuhopecten yessoensis]|uniref:type I inositol 1,4,5-trisphosphate 5-phosphatase-like isoform X2 n=1 Tax=Mizuhopecten yessoensis TaxID=6573 RepID=UPI000B45E5DF|nr:type I inositol 1,4,5-trisphosphate 5-phosphatase-like isoform X2 [Mizuhopecten yessoensis]
MDGPYTRVLLISANVGSIFEDPDHMLKLWLTEFLKTVQQYEPGLLALHCQEVGGKNYEASMQHVNSFVKSMLGCEELQKYDRVRVFLDEDYTAADKFTALGNLYFIHESIDDVMIWDFVDCKFVPVLGREVLSGNIENVQIKEKAKFPQDFFPDFKWSRKGFIRTRWNIRNCLFDLVNIHLFHDASNIIAMQTSPSVYSNNRKAALLHTLQRFEKDQYDKVPMFIFGDFNFRLDVHQLVSSLTSKTKTHQTKGKKDQIAKIVYSEEGNGKTVLSIETKGFDHHDKHAEVFSKKAKYLRPYDKEIYSYKDKLYEFDISFAPSYPFSEDITDGLSYMKTRCPSWCDRILMSSSAKNIVVNEDKYQPRYDIIGKEICMGDHKPVYLYLHIKRSQGNGLPVSDVTPTHRQLIKSLSINGEVVQVDHLEDINIHDFATFEKEQHLLPEFKNSIRQKRYSAPEQRSKDKLKLFQQMGRKPSFQEIAKTVQAVEKVLIRWPRRSRNRHHSSSSEDDLDENVSCSDKKKGKVDAGDITIELGESSSAGIGDIGTDKSSIHTTTSDITNTDDSNPVTPAKQPYTDAGSPADPSNTVPGDGSALTSDKSLHDQTVLSSVVKTHAHEADECGLVIDGHAPHPTALGSATLLLNKKGSPRNQPPHSSSSTDQSSHSVGT